MYVSSDFTTRYPGIESFTTFTTGPTFGTVTSTHTIAGTFTNTLLTSTDVQVDEQVEARVLVTLPPGCKSDIVFGKALGANSDISGLGVVLAFTVSAYAVLIWSLIAYRFGLIPSHLLRNADRILFRANSNRVNTEWQVSLEKAAIIFSDQQIITGISIMLAAYASLFKERASGQQPLSAYHWQIASYLAWMSSYVHLATLSFLRPWLQQNRVLSAGRVVGMTVLVVLLLSALVPTLSATWLVVTTHPQGFGVPAFCFWSRLGAVSPSTPLSFMLLIVSYVWKVGQLHDATKNRFRKCFRCTPEWILERTMIHLLQVPQGPSWWRRALFRVVAMMYVPFVATYEFLESFAASLWLVTLGLVWGSIQIFVPKSQTPEAVRAQENPIWNFGQILPLLFLLQPAAALFEHYYGTARNEDQDQNAGERHEMAIQGAHQGADPANSTSQFHKLSEVLLSRGSCTPSKKTKTQVIEPQLDFLYQSRFFKSIMWIIQTLVLILAVVVFFFERTTYAANWAGFSAENWQLLNSLDPTGEVSMIGIMLFELGSASNVLAAFIWGNIVLSVIVLVGSFFSKAFR